jgi:hypothetical protein
MDKYLPLLTIIFVFTLLAGAVSCALWFFLIAPRRIRNAVRARFGPQAIRAAVKTCFGYWLLILVLSFASGAMAAFWSWRYLGLWLYNAVGGWREWVAMLLSNTAWAPQFPSPSLGYAPIFPVGASLCVVVGVFTGVYIGTVVGTLRASRRFLITKTMF